MIIPRGTTGGELMKQADFRAAAQMAAALLGMRYLQSMHNTREEAVEEGRREEEQARQAEAERMRPTIDAMRNKTSSAKSYAQASGALMAKHAFGGALAKGLWSGASSAGNFVGGLTGLTKGKALGGLALAGTGYGIHKATKATVGELESPAHSTHNWGGVQPGRKTRINEYGVAVY